MERPLDYSLNRGYGYSGGIAEVNVRDYLSIVLKRKWLILTLLVVVTSLVTIQMYRLPSIYEATSVIQIEPKKDSVLKTGKEIVINNGNQKDPAYWATQLELLKSPMLARQVAISLDLQHNPAFLGTQGQQGVFTTLRKLFTNRKPAEQKSSAEPNAEVQVVNSDAVASNQMTPEQLEKLEPYEAAIAAGLTVEPVANTNLVRLKFTHTDPELAQKVANTTAEVFAYNNLDKATSGTKEASLLIAQKIGELQIKIKQEEEQKMNYIIKNNLPLTASSGQGQETNLTKQQTEEYSRQLLAAENERKNAEALYFQAKNAADPTSIPEVQDDKRIQKLREKLDELRQKRAELLAIYTPEWPDVQKVDEQIKPLEEALKKAPKEVVANLETKYKSALQKENAIRASYQSSYSQTTTQSVASIQLGVMDSQLETDKQSYQLLLAKQRELENTSGDSQANNVSVVQPSRTPHAPVGPPRVRNILIAMLLSLGAGVGLAFLLDYLDDTLKSVDDVDKYIHLPALALIPSNRSERRLKGKSSGPAEGEATALALIDDVRSPIAESYRHLRTSLLLSSAGQPPKTILVTSSQPSEGKTTTAVNTAVMLAQTGAEVVILDCDLRRPRLHAHFNLPNLRGVTNFLSGDSDLDASLQAYERLPNLKIMSSGPVPPNPAELLGSDEMRRLLAILGERFTHVIVDSPPAISFTDASILSTMVDGVMLVVHGGRSSRAVVRRAKQQLLDVGAHIFGVVLNNVKLESSDYYYYPGYYSSYYSSDDEVAGGAPEGGGSH